LHQIVHVGVTKRMGLKLFGREISKYSNLSENHTPNPNVTDRQTDELLSHNRALHSIAR